MRAVLQVKALESFTRYCCEVRDKGGASDVATASTALRRRTEELLDFDTDRITDTWNQSHEVRFNEIHWLYDGNVSLLGSITIGDCPLGECPVFRDLFTLNGFCMCPYEKYGAVANEIFLFSKLTVNINEN